MLNARLLLERLLTHMGQKEELLLAKIEKLRKKRKDLLIRISAIEDQIADYRGDIDILQSKEKKDNN